jgi:AcrR family transcriptional regulator
MAKKKTTIQDDSTEERIKNATRIVFHKKGFAATRTRDIVEEAGINLALLNYYFRSKERLFEIIMLETMSRFMQSILAVFNDESTTLENKIEIVATSYIDLLLVEPEIPLFILSELRGGNPKKIFSKLNGKELILKTVFAKQYTQAVKDGKIANVPIMQIVTNIIGLSVFPFVASPLLRIISDMKEEQFRSMMLERKKLIPIWINAILQTK